MGGGQVGIERRPVGVFLVEEKPCVIVLVDTHLEGMAFRFPFERIAGLLYQGLPKGLAVLRLDFEFNGNNVHAAHSGLIHQGGMVAQSAWKASASSVDGSAPGGSQGPMSSTPPLLPWTGGGGRCRPKRYTALSDPKSSR